MFTIHIFYTLKIYLCHANMFYKGLQYQNDMYVLNEDLLSLRKINLQSLDI